MKLLPNHTPGRGPSGSPKGEADAVLLEHSGCTNVGKAHLNNEDALLAGTGRDERLYVVADGMGGHEAGELASFLAVATLERLWPHGSLVEAIRRADRTIFACRDDGEFAGMGTTVIALRFREDIAYYMRVSPLYRNPDGTWPKVPEGHKVGDRYISTRDSKSVQWKRLYRLLELRSEDEVLVFLVAHEAFHYLRRTRQVEGRHG